MKKQLKDAGLVAALVAMASVAQVRAADMAVASGVLASVSTMAVQAQAGLASAAAAGNVKAIAVATKRADAVDAAVADAQKAYVAMESAVASGDPDSVASAFENLKAAEQRALDALSNDDIPDVPPPGAVKDDWKESTNNTGGGPMDAYDAPNIREVPWRSAGLRSLYDSLFGAFWTSTTAGGTLDAGRGDRDATPE